MGQNSEISWTHHTANLWWGCVEVSPLCDNCYARSWAKRYDRAKWGADEPRLTIKGVWKDLEKFQRLAAAIGEVHRVFVGSMMDIFERPMPVVDAKGELVGGVTTGNLRDSFFRSVVPACPNLLFLLLTKRPGNITKYVPPEWMTNWPGNVMTGTSVGDQPTADAAMPKIVAAPGRHFLSCEPLLGPIEFSDVGRRSDAVRMLGRPALSGIDWVIVGGESGPHSRPMHPRWARSIRDQCAAVGTPFHFKQWGEFGPDRGDTDAKFVNVNSGIAMDAPTPMYRVGKHAAGRLLDGRTWDEFTAPAVPTP